MPSILHTGDLHLGRRYNKDDSDVAQKYIRARMQALKNAVDIGNQENCGYLVIAGDLYDRVANIPASLHKEVSAALAEFNGEVLVIPGNHDYYDPDTDELWRRFEEHSPSNTRLLKANVPYETGDMVFYPCVCHARHSPNNALGWLEDLPERNPGKFHVGVAHGALEGLSQDSERNYYYMTAQELRDKRMDVWLLGHTHIPYPAQLDNTAEQRIFNAGTPQQTDIADHSAGEAFVIQIDGNKRVTARSYRTGVVRFVQKYVMLRRGQDLAQALDFPDLHADSTSLRVYLSGVISTQDYENRGEIYEALKERYLFAEVIEDNLRKEITPQMVDQETVEGSVLHTLLTSYTDEPDLLNLAYDLVLACKEET